MMKNKKKVNPNSTDTLIGEKSKVEGNIKSEASLRIEGTVFGNIDCGGDVIVGKDGVVESDITARNVTAAGKIHGSVEAQGLLSILPSGEVQGNIKVKSLSIAEGGIFLGSSTMDKLQEGSQSHKLHKFERNHVSNQDDVKGKKNEGKLDKQAASQ